jgi:hypothetical protein
MHRHLKEMMMWGEVKTIIDYHRWIIAECKRDLRRKREDREYEHEQVVRAKKYHEAELTKEVARSLLKGPTEFVSDKTWRIR